MCVLLFVRKDFKGKIALSEEKFDSCRFTSVRARGSAQKGFAFPLGMYIFITE